MEGAMGECQPYSRENCGRPRLARANHRQLLLYLPPAGTDKMGAVLLAPFQTSQKKVSRSNRFLNADRYDNMPRRI